MSERTRTGTGTAPAKPVGDLGRRLTARRIQVGLSRREAAARAGMATSYLGYLENHPGATPSTGALLRLAEALETTVTDLSGGTVNQADQADQAAQSALPAGTGRAGRSPEFTELRPGECRALLASHGVGRIAVPTSSGPVIVPVNYSVVDEAIVFRTARGATPALGDGRQVGFEVDHIDEAFSQGWSVLARGTARVVTDPQEQRRLTQRAYSAPWAGGSRNLWVRIRPFTVSGRRITV
ncbi:helix-turn-helix domain-containing protein [Streptomyces sp. NPDC004629]|uniref:helix-turn-helix domain-containing protein n=1 Tax=Streptomyces sp. NPDC004629 TaxID=3364705 RepID=UPI00367A3BC4